MNGLKRIIKLFFSDYLISKITSISYGWHGNYNAWEETKSKCSGYSDDQILERVKKNALKVKYGEIPYERDSVAFEKIEYSFPLLSGLLWISIKNGNRINILDFGGALGTGYYQNKPFLDALAECNWCVVEQPHFVAEGINSFSTNNLHFFYSIDECMKMYKINAVLFSSVIQYLEKPYDILEEIVCREIDYIIIDRTIFIESENDRLTIQTVPKKIYSAKYPCWFLSENKFLKVMSEKYELIFDFYIKENINIKSSYKGFLFKRKE